MFEWLKSMVFKSKPTSSTKPDFVSFKPQPTSADVEKEDTWVYFWKTTARNGVGHAAIQVGGDQPKMKPEDPGEYISIHPDVIPAIGPTIFLPLPAHLATTLAEDMETQAASRTQLISDFDSSPLPLQNLLSIPPDQTIRIKNLDTKAMLAHIEQTRKQVEEGQTTYQLVPKVNMLGFFQDAPYFISQDPLDVLMNKRFLSGHKKTTNQAMHCSMLVSEILTSGGAHIAPSKMPWGITPNNLAEQISNGPKC